jgi:hypothetical protein
MFYSVPSNPVSNRMKIWRKLAKAGAAQLKGSVYILPATEEHEEFLQWLIGEVKSMGGDGAFVRTPEIRTMAESDIIRLFTTQAGEEYSRLEKPLEAVERRVQSIRKGSKNDEGKRLTAQAAKIAKDVEDIGKRDWFNSPTGQSFKKRLQALETAAREAGKKAADEVSPISPRQIRDYQGKKWATRKKPFVDRMASAWFVRRFIDPQASFVFVDERDAASLNASTVAFDVRGGEFTHVGDLCTFEVMVKSFGIRDKAVKKIAEIVHDLDVKDDKYTRPEASGIEEILTGIRKAGKKDEEMIVEGISVFELLYQSAK